MNKKLLTIALSAIMLEACGPSQADRQNSASRDIYNAADSMFQNGQYQQSLALLDSIDRSIPSAVDIRRMASRLRPQVMERYAAAQLSRIDSLSIAGTIAGDSLRQFVKFVNHDMEGYYVALPDRGTENPRNTPGIYARMSPDYNFYIIATAPTKAAITRLSLSAPGQESVTTPDIAPDGERNGSCPAGRIITLTEAESDPLARFIIRTPSDTPIKLSFLTPEATVAASLTLTEKQRQSIATLRRFVQTIDSDKFYRLEKERLQLILTQVRQQTANLAE